MVFRTIDSASVWKAALERGLVPRGYLLIVDVRRQTLQVWSSHGLGGVYPVSTSARGLGTRHESNKTPTGWHRIADRFGHGRPLGSVFVSRRLKGEVMPPPTWRMKGGPDRILSRILWLRGLELGRNLGPGVDSFARYIYIHGTNQEQLLGRPASHGCIRMGNKDIVKLFRLIRGRPTWCWIGQRPAKRRV